MIGLLGLGLFGLHMARTHPPENFQEAARALEADASWTFRLDSIQALVPDQPDDESMMDQIWNDLQPALRALHPHGQVFIFDSADNEPTSDWIAMLSFRKPQAFYRRGITRLLDDAAAAARAREIPVHYSMNDRRILIATTEKRLQTAIEVLEVQMPHSEPSLKNALPPDSISERYSGPWRLLPETMRERMKPLLGDWPDKAQEKTNVQLDWLRNSSNASLKITLGDGEDPRALAQAIFGENLPPEIAKSLETGTEKKVLVLSFKNLPIFKSGKQDASELKKEISWQP